MKRLVSTVLLLLLLTALLPALLPAHAQTSPRIDVKSQYIIDRYGFATINETVRFTNNGSAAVQVPSLSFGVGNLSSRVAGYNLTGKGFSLGTPASPGGPFSVSGGSLVGGNSSSYVLSVLINGVVSNAKNGSLQVLTLSTPSISNTVDRVVEVVQMPASTAFRSPPLGLKANLGGTNNTYSASFTNVAPQSAQTSVRAIVKSTNQDFHPLRVYGAARVISAGSTGSPLLTDTIKFGNLGTTALTGLYVDALAPSNARVTILASADPRLINPYTIPLTGGAIDLSLVAVGYPTSGVPTGANYTISYQYALGSTYFSVSGGQVKISMPERPPIEAFVDSYTISLALPQGASVMQGAPGHLTNVSPWQSGHSQVAYALTIGWAIDSAVPAASVMFVLLLLGLFVARTTTAEEEVAEEEESSGELASTMIKTFDEKTNLINGLWPEIEAKDPNELDKAYFDELRGRLDTFRSRALQRLNEVRQKAASQRFAEVVGQIQVTEREVERAAKDKLNLYQQYYLKQMRKEVYDRLLPQYTKRLERALNQLSDELHTVQREAKLL
ncbi:MAG: hypothetical protein OK436_03475 [Thaumarchaeota archaeon]|nr:hypothetical protein [Nitrososphaerota archaeon]